MIRASIRIALVGLLILAAFPVACSRTAPVPRKTGSRVVKDTVRVVKDTVRVAPIFKDTALTNFTPAGARSFRLRDPAQRDSFRATLRRERALWRANNLRDYQFLLRVACFCPGVRGWLLMEVRSGRLVRARDSTGKSAPLNDWNTLTIDALFDDLERKADIDAVVQIAFDPRWHFPVYISTVRLPGPDTWGYTEARGLRPL